jgi:hypothetical protein
MDMASTVPIRQVSRSARTISARRLATQAFRRAQARTAAAQPGRRREATTRASRARHRSLRHEGDRSACATRCHLLAGTPTRKGREGWNGRKWGSPPPRRPVAKRGLVTTGSVLGGILLLALIGNIGIDGGTKTMAATTTVTKTVTVKEAASPVNEARNRRN